MGVAAACDAVLKRDRLITGGLALAIDPLRKLDPAHNARGGAADEGAHRRRLQRLLALDQETQRGERADLQELVLREALSDER